MGAFEIFVAHVQPYIPDAVVRLVLWLVLQYTLWRMSSKDWPQKELRFVKRSSEMSNIAEETVSANEQHYEVPTGFFFAHLGPCMKYSSCEFEGASDLEMAETRTLDKYLEHLKMDETVQRVLDIGCGWGSFSLYAAQKYPQVQFVCFSNSHTQKEFIHLQAQKRKLVNLKVVKADINDMSLETLDETLLFDRVVSIECLEHSKNYEEIFSRIRSMLNQKGRCFFQLLCHREYTYHMSNDSWMGRNFFTGGTIPSTKLFYHFNKHLVVEKQVVIDGRAYSRTLDAWLGRMYRARDRVIQALQEGNAKGNGELEYQRWRMFYLMSSAAFGINRGQDWMVTYLVMVPR